MASTSKGNTAELKRKKNSNFADGLLGRLGNTIALLVILSISAVKCDVPTIPKNGSIITPKTTFEYNDIIKFKCKDGFKLVGSEALQCLSSGKWFGHQPKCEGKCS